jgi:hypothetical protein
MNGTLRLDAESVSDTLAILGAVAQGAQLIGQLRIVKAGNSFIAAAKTGDEAALKAAVEALEAARKAGEILHATSTVTNVGGLIWGDLVSIDRLVQLQRDEIDGKITHAEARRQRADMFASAVTSHGIMLAGMLRPRGAEKASGMENPPPERVAPEATRKSTQPETMPESELADRAAEGTVPKVQGQSSTESKPNGVRTRFRTPDNLHEIFILNDGTIYRCSLTCAQLRTWYDVYLKSQPEGTRRQEAAQLDSRLQALEARAAGGEKTPALEEAIGNLDRTLRDFIAPDLTAELQRGAESRKFVKSGEKFLTPDQIRNMLRFFTVDEIQALTGPDGLSSAEAIRRFATDLVNLQRFTSKADAAALKSLLNTVVTGGTQRTAAVDFIARVARISKVEGVKFDFTELYAAFQRGDAILDHGPLQTGRFLNDMVGGVRSVLGEGRLDVGTGAGRMPASLMSAPVLDFVIIETNGTFQLVLGLEHSGLSGGRASVFAAGRIRFNRQGIVTEVDNISGHYLPSAENLDRAVKFMYDRNILSPQRPVKVTYVK